MTRKRSYPIGATTSILSPAGRGLVAAIEAKERAKTKSKPPSAKAIDALAEAWASIDGKAEIYQKEKADPNADVMAEGYQGVFMGYQSEAEELISRLRSRGFDIVPIKRRA